VTISTKARSATALWAVGLIGASLALAACGSAPATVLSDPPTTTARTTSHPATTTTTTVPATTTTAPATPGIGSWQGQTSYTDSAGSWTVKWTFTGGAASYSTIGNHGSYGSVTLPVSGSFVLANTGTQPQKGESLAIIAYFPPGSALCSGLPNPLVNESAHVVTNGVQKTAACALPLLEGKFDSDTTIAPQAFAAEKGVGYDSYQDQYIITVGVYVPDLATPTHTADVTAVLQALDNTQPVLAVATNHDDAFGGFTTPLCSVSFPDLQSWQVLMSKPAGLQCS
jgi:hypothetical protein